MEWFEILGFVIAFLVGVVMGLIGGGGSLLLPAFLYLLKINDLLATAYTLLLVGVTAAFGAIPRIRENQVDYHSVFALGGPILIGTLFVRYGLQFIPETLFEIGSLVVVTRQMLTLLIFASVLVLSFASLQGLIGKNLQPRPNWRGDAPSQYFSVLVFGGLAIGAISASIGAGGGVMIVPLLVVLMRKDMKTVVGTSLTIMALKSPISFFLCDAVVHWNEIDWRFLLSFLIVMVTGVVTGSYFSERIDSEKLKKLFAWFILFMAIYIFGRELLFK